MNLDSLKPPDHGKEVKLDLNDARIKDTMSRVMYHQQSIAIALVEILSGGDNKTVIIPCVRCFRDVALLCHDMGELMKELVKDH